MAASTWAMVAAARLGGGGWNYAHDNVVVSTTNYGISVNGANNYATNNVLVNDGAEQDSSFGQAIVAMAGSVTGWGALHRQLLQLAPLHH